MRGGGYCLKLQWLNSHLLSTAVSATLAASTAAALPSTATAASTGRRGAGTTASSASRGRRATGLSAVVARGRAVLWVLRGGKELPVDEAEEDDSNNPHGDHGLEVLQPELVLEGGGALLKLGAAVLQGVGALLQGGELGVTLKTAVAQIRENFVIILALPTYITINADNFVSSLL